MNVHKKPLKNICIAGGGSAGWMAACLLHKRLANSGVQITLVESPSIGIIGVGEGSTPTLKTFFDELEIAESEWMPACNATYKVSIEFENWSPKSGNKSYQHPFFNELDTLHQRKFLTNCVTRRLGLDVETRPDKFFLNGWLANHQFGPTPTSNFPFKIEYGYHFDSGLLGEFLKEWATESGVTHIQGDIEKVNTQAAEHIDSLLLKSGELIEADLFIDCTGFRSLLLQQALGVDFIKFESNLFNDSAVALPTQPLSPLPTQTKATALSSGWAWQIPLTNRTGNGYVYSSKYITKEQAEKELREHLRQYGPVDDNTPARHLTMNVGQVAQHWKGNCIAIGLAEGFIEPLEATALHLVLTNVDDIVRHIDINNLNDSKVSEYNVNSSGRFEAVRDYIVAHYMLSSRDDTQYWRDVRTKSVPSSDLKQIMGHWYANKDLTSEVQDMQPLSHFNALSWNCLLSGYGVFPNLAKNQPNQGDMYKEHQLSDYFSGCLENFSRPNYIT